MIGLIIQSTLLGTPMTTRTTATIKIAGAEIHIYFQCHISMRSCNELRSSNS